MLSEASRIPVATVLRPLMERLAAADGRALPGTGGGDPKGKKVGGLVLTRHLDESIMIGDEVEVQVVGIKAGAVRLKIVAPRSISVHRREVFDAIRETPAVAPPAREPAPARPGKPPGGLVLTRSPLQSIMIGDEVELVVVEIRPTTVKIKILAPRSVAVHRREVFDSIRGGEG